MINLPQESKDKLNNIPESINYSNIESKLNEILEKANNGIKTTSKEFIGYGKEDVRTLLKDSYKKCVYCETVGNLNIEHYRPKAKVREFDGLKTFPVKDSDNNLHWGYYWLAYEFSNFLWVCYDCNAGEGAKHNRFPTKNTHIFKHSTDKQKWNVNSQTLLDEEALLLHPLVDNPEEHLKINYKGELEAINNSEKGSMTIKVCNLNRASLRRDERKKITENFFKQTQEQLLNLIAYEESNNIETLIEDKGLQKIVLLFKTYFDELKENTKWDKKFSRVYFFIYTEFENFAKNSVINRILTEDELEFLIKIFKYYKQNN